MKLLDVWINCPSKDVAEELAEDLIERRLAACANIFGGVQSIFHWKGGIDRESEVPLLVKTRAELFDALTERALEIHPYETPGIIAVPLMRVNEAYGSWLAVETAEARVD